MGWVTRRRLRLNNSTKIEVSKSAAKMMVDHGFSARDITPNAAGKITMREVKTYIENLPGPIPDPKGEEE